MLQTIDISELLPGMYVVSVTKQKGDLKVKASGKVKSTEYIENIASKGVLELQIDLTKSTHTTPGQVKDSDYSNHSGLTYNQQLERALALHDQAKSIHNRLVKNALKGRLNDCNDAIKVTENVVDAAFEYDDALGIVTLLKEDVEYFLEHGINCSILMALFGRTLGFDEALLKKVSLGAMLMDIGMLKLPMLLTQKNDTLTAQEYTKIKTHVGIALKLVKPLDKVDEISIQVIQQHHERLDGSGYPDGLQESQISLYGRMAAIVDTYDSLTSSRPFRKALKPADALVKLTEATQTLDQELVQKFITCMGAYPAGSLVKLASGKIAMVIRINKTQPLSPVVMVFYDTQTRQDKVMRIDLSKTDDKIISSIELDEVNMGIPQLLQQNLS